MIGPSPWSRWGDYLMIVNKKRPDYDIFNIRLKDGAPDRYKTELETYVMIEMSGDFVLKKLYPKMKEPYYTWEGRVVEKSSLRRRALPAVV